MANTNLVTNPSFETNMTGWTFANATTAQDGTPNVTPGTGVFSCKVTATSTVGPSSATFAVSGLTVGRNYTFSFFVKIAAAAIDFSVVPNVTGSFVSQKPLRTGDNFVRRFVGFQATATTANLVIQSEGNLPTGDAFWVDRVQLNEGGLLPYFDGSYPYSTWTGAANASTSTNSAFTTALVGDNPTTDEVVVVNGLCLNTLGWNVTSKNGRYAVAPTRGDDYSIPGANGKLFVANKPLDTGLYTLTMFVLGANPDGTIPSSPASRALLEHNVEQILRQCYSTSAPVTIHQWQPNGAVRVAQATLSGSTAPDISMQVGGRRADLNLAFSVLNGTWSDFQSTTVTGTASAAWSNQTLTLTALRNGTGIIDDSIITVTGPITNPTVSNVATATSVTFTGTVPAGQTWVVDAGQFTSRVNGTSVLNATTHVGHPRFLLIDPGNAFLAPIITLTGTATSAATNLSITASRKHLVS